MILTTQEEGRVIMMPFRYNHSSQRSAWVWHACMNGLWLVFEVYCIVALRWRWRDTGCV